MGDFAESPKWKLVNDFTIHEDRNLSDRPFMRTCVPKRLDVGVTSFEVVRLIEWPSSYEDENRPNSYTDRSYIRFGGNLDDKIIIFTMEGGEIGTFRTLTDATIRRLAAGQIGGKHKATVFDGIGYSGMSSQDVPAQGLMEGEPGALSFHAEYEERPGSGEKVPPSLTATLFLDEENFSRLFMTLSRSPRPIAMFKLNILAELFESEVSASLSEPWMSHDYGLLMKGASIATASARIESIAVSTGETKLNAPGDDDDDASVIDKVLGINNQQKKTGIVGSDYSKALLRYQRYIFVALLALIAVTLFLR